MEVLFNGKAAIVTGGASGMGAALVRLLVEGGGQVMIADIEEAKGAALAAELGARARFHRTDITKLDQCERLAQATMDAFGRIDILYNNAARGELGDTLGISPEQWDAIIDVGLSGAFRMTRAVLPHMKAGGGGAIVNTCSVSGLGGDYGMVAYNSAKGGLINLTRCLALDHAKDNIRVNAICPGVIADTTMAAPLHTAPGGLATWNAKIAMGRTGLSVEVARVMAFLGSDLASYMTGSVVVVDGGLLAHTGLPKPDDFVPAAARN
jgi:meso-butanediol dehydrogenase/(S,S)-butanediol dehydrogenase/diacetyl reductase